ncbi:MAG: hypothetical protein NT077_03030 [Candidatus Taylorbacteria bacterium]|nr:hypothetical protein [Candidatus Taylorbacteria bacterium]
MKTSPISKKTIIAIVVIVVLALVYFYFAGGETTSTNSMLLGAESNSVGAAELSLLNQMKSLRIDTTLFSDPAYISLVDYSTKITAQNVGRPNPFAPVPGVPDPFAAESPLTPSAPAAPRTGR